MAFKHSKFKAIFPKSQERANERGTHTHPPYMCMSIPPPSPCLRLSEAGRAMFTKLRKPQECAQAVSPADCPPNLPNPSGRVIKEGPILTHRLQSSVCLPHRGAWRASTARIAADRAGCTTVRCRHVAPNRSGPSSRAHRRSSRSHRCRARSTGRCRWRLGWPWSAQRWSLSCRCFGRLREGRRGGSEKSAHPPQQGNSQP